MYAKDTMLSTLPVERLAQALGHTLLTDVRRQERKGSLTELFYTTLMGLATQNDKLKIELFRFVDALPALRTPESLARHLTEYLVRPDVPLPPGGAQLLNTMASTSFTRTLLSFATHTGANLMAQRFIAGRNGDEAVREIKRLRRVPMTFTLDLLGEAVTSEHEARAYQQQYRAIIDDMARLSHQWAAHPQLETASYGTLPKVNISVKLSSLYARFDPMAADATVATVKARLEPICWPPDNTACSSISTWSNTTTAPLPNASSWRL